MAKAICVYAVYFSPPLWLLGFFGSVAFAEPGPQLLVDVLTTIAGLVATVLMVIGGLGLGQLRLSGLKRLKTGLIVSLASTGVGLLAALGGGSGSGDATGEVEVAAGAVLFFLVLLVLALAALAFEITALIWLLNNEKKLPLRRK